MSDAANTENAQMPTGKLDDTNPEQNPPLETRKLDEKATVQLNVADLPELKQTPEATIAKSTANPYSTTMLSADELAQAFQAPPPAEAKPQNPFATTTLSADELKNAMQDQPPAINEQSMRGGAVADTQNWRSSVPTPDQPTYREPNTVVKSTSYGQPDQFQSAQQPNNPMPPQQFNQSGLSQPASGASAGMLKDKMPLILVGLGVLLIIIAVILAL